MKTKMNFQERCDHRLDRSNNLTQRVATFASALLVLLLPFTVGAQVSSTSGDVVPVPRSVVVAVGSLEPGSFTSDTVIRLIMEQDDVELTSDMDVDIIAPGTYGTVLSPGTIAAGEAVASVLIHADRASSSGISFLNGVVEFSSEILGVVMQRATLDPWDSVVGLPGVNYPTGEPLRGIDVGSPGHPDVIVVDSNRLELDLETLGMLDQLRVILAGNGRGVSFSIDYQGPTHGTVPSFGTPPITAGDVLTPGAGGSPGPNRPVPGPTIGPGSMLKPADLGILVPGMNGVYEVDALSFGHDRGGRLRFSVDEFATGVPGGLPPNVYSEGEVGNQEASADIFAYLGPWGSTDPAFTPGNRAVLDGNGVAPTGDPGFGLIEPNPASWKITPDVGDNLDAIDLGTRSWQLQGRIYFSLDSDFADVAETNTGPPPNCGTAVANGFDAADVLVWDPAVGTISEYADAASLGLDTFDKPDDIDALIVWDDGDGVFEQGIDLIRFSLRRGSGSVDNLYCPIWGLLINEADVLAPGPVIFIAGESLGLNTLRGGDIGDDLNALDRVRPRRAPVGNDDFGNVNPGGQEWIPVLDNDYSLDEPLVPSTLTIIEPPQHGVIESIDPQTGRVLYQHNGSKSGEDSFTYMVYDESGEFTEPTTVVVSVTVTDVTPSDERRRTVMSFAGPNPFTAGTAFMLRPASNGHATVVVYNLAGRRVRTLLDENLAAGEIRQLAWDGRDDNHQSTAAGVYLVEMRIGDDVKRLRAIRLR